MKPATCPFILDAVGVQNLQNPGNSTGIKTMSKSTHLHASNTNYSSKGSTEGRYSFGIFLFNPVRVPQRSQRTDFFFGVSYLFCPSPKASQISSNSDVIFSENPSLQMRCSSLRFLYLWISRCNPHLGIWKILCPLCVCFCVFPRMFLGSISFP